MANNRGYHKMHLQPCTTPAAGDAKIAGLGRGVAATRCGDPELLLDPGPLHRGSWDIWDPGTETTWDCDKNLMGSMEGLDMSRYSEYLFNCRFSITVKPVSSHYQITISRHYQALLKVVI